MPHIYAKNADDLFFAQGFVAAQDRLFQLDLWRRIGVGELSEVIGPGVACECIESKDGPHIWEDHFYPETIDPATGKSLADGEVGELVFTTLTKEAMPIVRYRTRDLSRLLPGTARSMRRMEKVTGRSDDMMIVRGINVFPSQIEEIILKDERLAPHFVIELRRLMAGEGFLRERLDDVAQVQRAVAYGLGRRRARGRRGAPAARNTRHRGGDCARCRLRFRGGVLAGVQADGRRPARGLAKGARRSVVLAARSNS